MIARQGSGFDVILISGEPYADHPLSPVGVIARVLDARGYKVGVIEHPDWRSAEDFKRLGRPRLYFGITSGSIDSMLVNYSPTKRQRCRDPHSPSFSRLPDRAIIVYSNRVREAFRNIPIVIGGIEASLRRFAHYDYWDNEVRRSLLLDARADILVYGPGEKQAVEIADRLSRWQELDGIPGTCVVRPTIPDGVEKIPSYEEVAENKEKFCQAQMKFSNHRLLAQGHAARYVIQYPAPDYQAEDLDLVFSLPFARRIPDNFPELQMARFSVQIHRGCAGRCSFCALYLHQGDRIISRSEQSILGEIEKITGHPEFKGYVDDLGAPAANMYGLDIALKKKRKEGHDVETLKLSHDILINLMRQARSIRGVKKVFVRSGIRYDLALKNKDYVAELVQHHVSGLLKIAPEHISPVVLKLMNKGGSREELESFRSLFYRDCGHLKQHLKYYFMVAHPGTTIKETEELAAFIRKLERQGERPVEGVQIFTPTPMTRSACMYYTGIDPDTGDEVYVPKSFQEKKAQKRLVEGHHKKIHSGKPTFSVNK